MSYSTLLLQLCDDHVEEDTSNDEKKALTGVENVNFPPMKIWIQEHLEGAAQKKMSASTKEENALLAEILEILSLLVKFGYYDNLNDIKHILKSLLQILNDYADKGKNLV